MKPKRSVVSPSMSGRFSLPLVIAAELLRKPLAYAGALIGSAIFFSIYHTHDGAYCYDDHGRSGDRYGDGGRREIVGCHRIERLPDGRERRIEVPLSECH